MKLSISNLAWNNLLNEEIFKELLKNGFDGIEIAPTKLLGENPYNKITEAKEFATYIKKEYNLEISSIQSIWYGKSENLFKSDYERNILIDYTKQAIDFANSINCKNLVFGCPKNRNISSMDDYNLAIDFFEKIGEYAESKNTFFSIEPNPSFYNTNFINTTQEAFDIVKKINCNAIKVNIDLGTIIANNEDVSIIDKNMNYINHIHISEPYLEVIKQRAEHEQLKNILIKNNYDKFISIEMKECNIEIIKKVISSIKKKFSFE